MNKQILKEEFGKGFKGIKFDYDEYTFTWGLSHHRFVKGLKENFSSIEEFFKEIMLSPDTFSSHRVGEAFWIQRNNFAHFVDGLKFSQVSEEEFNNCILRSIIESKKYEQEIDLDKIEMPKTHEKAITIKETENPRFYINTYTGFISSNNNGYFFYELQFES